eukprot:921419-Pelagomonas_calceolata.AAC.1
MCSNGDSARHGFNKPEHSVRLSSCTCFVLHRVLETSRTRLASKDKPKHLLVHDACASLGAGFVLALPLSLYGGALPFRT